MGMGMGDGCDRVDRLGGRCGPGADDSPEKAFRTAEETPGSPEAVPLVPGLTRSGASYILK